MINLDPSGTAWWHIFASILIVAVVAVVAVATAGTAVGVIAAGAAIGGAVGGIAGGVSGTISAAQNGTDIFDGFSGGMFSGTITGTISGALAASPLGVGWQMAGNAILNSGEYLVNSIINNNFDIVNLGISVGTGLIAGRLGGPGLQFLDGKTLQTAGTIIAKNLVIKELSKKSFKVALDYLLPITIGSVANIIGVLLRDIIKP